jgi:hypothetical protein
MNIIDAIDEVHRIRCELKLLATLAGSNGALVMDENDTFGLFLVLGRLVDKLDAVLKTMNEGRGGEV